MENARRPSFRRYPGAFHPVQPISSERAGPVGTGQVTAWRPGVSSPGNTCLPQGREVGEIPTQSRYGDRSPPGCESPVAGPAEVLATFVREAGQMCFTTG